MIENEEYYVEDINTEERNVFQLAEEQDQDDPDYDTIRNAVKVINSFNIIFRYPNLILFLR